MILSIPGGNPDTINNTLNQYSNLFDLYEIRLDLNDEQYSTISLSRNSQLIITLRETSDGGKWQGSSSEKIRLLGKYANLDNVKYIDLELDFVKENDIPGSIKEKLLISRHMYKPLSRKGIEELFHDMISYKPKAIKLACNIEKYQDLINLRKADKPKNIPFIFAGMSHLGKLSRIIYKLLGGDDTFAGLKGLETNPLQLTPDETMLYQPDSINDNTALFGLAGGGQIMKSPGYEHYNGMFKEKNYNARYLPFQVDDVEDFKRFADELNIKGLSITMPLKETLPKAYGCESVSNLMIRGSSDIGFSNTDRYAVVQSLIEIQALAYEAVCVLGAGGAAHTVCEVLHEKNYEFYIVNRSRERGVQLAEEFGVEYLSINGVSNAKVDILINCTPIGMTAEVPDDISRILGRAKVIDLAYTQGQTPLIIGSAGQLSVDGRVFWHYQAREQLRQFLAAAGCSE